MKTLSSIARILQIIKIGVYFFAVLLTFFILSFPSTAQEIRDYFLPEHNTDSSYEES